MSSSEVLSIWLPKSFSCSAAKETPGGKKEKYILYDVNPGEGFNLRRDVFMRVAVLVRQADLYVSTMYFLRFF
jgi:hypothetical protein